ncbi:MAG: hypothetical protein HZA50_18220 [Planctomycetes bacterium]|nr:hypothetical protein [Planctomycetota bacterium]
MKKAIIAALICANLVLAGALVAVNLMPATAQTLTLNAKTNYAITTCIVGDDYEAMLILDSTTQKLAAFRLEKDASALVPYSPRDLSGDKGDFK